MDIDTVIPAAVNIEAELEFAARQAKRKGNDRQTCGKGKGSPGQGSSGQANSFQKQGDSGKQGGFGKQRGGGRQRGRQPKAEDQCLECEKNGQGIAKGRAQG